MSEGSSQRPEEHTVDSGNFGWSFTSGILYPFLFSKLQNTWLWYFEGTERWFHQFSDGEDLFLPLNE